MSLLLISISISGCSWLPKQTETLTVYVPVTRPIEIEQPVRPTLAISQLKKDATDGDIAKAYVASVQQLIGYVKQLETLLHWLEENEFTTPSDNNKNTNKNNEDQ